MSDSKITSEHKRVFRLIAFVFLFLNLVIPHTGGDNAASRYAASLSLAARGTLYIDGLESMTGDWSRPPDGHYYSNKAPLPALLGAPIVWAAGLILVPSGADEKTYFEIMTSHSARVRMLMSWILQVLPALLIAWLLVRILVTRGASKYAINLCLLSVFFGSTASVYFNNFFGHGMAALLILLAALLVMHGPKRWIALSAFAFGAAQLSDYGCAFLLPGFVFLWLSDSGKTQIKKTLFSIAAGAALPALTWWWYHTVCFGGPLSLPTKFQNPVYVDVPALSGAGESALWGIFHSYPKPGILAELLFGYSRGLLVTQPWMLFIWTISIIWSVRLLISLRATRSRPDRDAVLDSVMFMLASGLTGLLVMNAAFGGWHGGLTNGPRYLTPVMLIGSLAFGLTWDRMNRIWQGLLKWGIAFALFYYVIGFSQDLQTEMNPWGQYVSSILQGRTIRIVRVCGAGIVMIWLWRKVRKDLNAPDSVL